MSFKDCGSLEISSMAVALASNTIFLHRINLTFTKSIGDCEQKSIFASIRSKKNVRNAQHQP